DTHEIGRDYNQSPHSAAAFGYTIFLCHFPFASTHHTPAIKSNERPRYFTVDEAVYEIAVVLDQSYEPSATYFKVQSTQGKNYLLRQDEDRDEGTLQSGFDDDELLARPSIELVTVDAIVAKRAEQQIESCEYCHHNDAEIPFDWMLADVTGKRGAFEFILS